MSQSQDGWLVVDATLAKLVADHGPWAILNRVTQILRPAFLALEAAGRQAERQAKKPPPRVCDNCGGNGCDPGNWKDNCQVCCGAGYLAHPSLIRCSICGDPNCSEPNQKH